MLTSTSPDCLSFHTTGQRHLSTLLTPSYPEESTQDDGRVGGQAGRIENFRNRAFVPHVLGMLTGADVALKSPSSLYSYPLQQTAGLQLDRVKDMGSNSRLSLPLPRLKLSRRMSKGRSEHFSKEILLPKAKHRLSEPDTCSTKQHVRYSRQDTTFPDTNRDNQEEVVPT